MSIEDLSGISVSRDTFGADALQRPGVAEHSAVAALITDNIIARQGQAFYVANRQLEAIGALVGDHRYIDGMLRVLGVTGPDEARVALVNQALSDAEFMMSGAIIPQSVLPEGALDLLPDLKRATQKEVLGAGSLVLAFR